jgi:hypothetical protein
MATYTCVKEYNNHLVNNNIDINIINYVKEVNNLIYNIDISFIDNFLDLVEEDKICIPHEYLIKYGVITMENKSSHVLRVLNQFDPIENKDYRLTNVGQPVKQGGIVIKKEYWGGANLTDATLRLSEYSSYFNQHNVMLVRL